MENKEITMGDRVFRITPFTGLRALTLDKKVLQIIAPAVSPLIGQIGTKGVEGQLDMTGLGAGVADALGRLSDAEFETFVGDLLAQTTIRDNNGTYLPVMAVDFAFAFPAGVIGVYQLIFEVMKVNKFSFFAIMESAGFGTMATAGSSEQTKSGFNLTRN